MRLTFCINKLFFDTGGPTPQATPGEVMKSYVQRSITQELQKRMGKTRNIVVSEELFRKDRSDTPLHSRHYPTNEGLSDFHFSGVLGVRIRSTCSEPQHLIWTGLLRPLNLDLSSSTWKSTRKHPLIRVLRRTCPNWISTTRHMRKVRWTHKLEQTMHRKNIALT